MVVTTVLIYRRGKWDSEIWQSPPQVSKKPASSEFQLILHKDRLKKTSPVKLAKEIKKSPDALLAAVNQKLLSACSNNLSLNNSLIFVTPKTIAVEEELNEVPDSNEQFRQFLQADRKRSFSIPKKLVSRSSSVPSMSPFTRTVSQDDSISTIHEDTPYTTDPRPATPSTGLPANSQSILTTPVLRSAAIPNPRTLAFELGTPQPPAPELPVSIDGSCLQDKVIPDLQQLRKVLKDPHH